APLVVPEHVNAIEIHFVERVRLIGTTLLEYQPAARLTLAPNILIVLVVGFTIKTLPRHKLTPGTVKNDITGNGELDLLAINPPSGRRRRLVRESHFVPKLIRLVLFLRLVSLLSGLRGAALLGAARFRRHVALDRL